MIKVDERIHALVDIGTVLTKIDEQ